MWVFISRWRLSEFIVCMEYSIRRNLSPLPMACVKCVL